MKKANKIKLLSTLGITLVVSNVLFFIFPFTSNTDISKNTLSTNVKSSNIENKASSIKFKRKKYIEDNIYTDPKINDDKAEADTDSLWDAWNSADLEVYSEIDAKKLFGDYLIGDIKDYKDVADINLDVINTNDSFKVAAKFDNIWKNIEYGYFKKFWITDKNDWDNWEILESYIGASYQLKQIWNSEINSVESDVEMKDYGLIGNDYNKIKTVVSTQYNSSKEKLIIKNKIHMESFDKATLHSTENLSITHITKPEGLKMTVDVTMPYTINDLETFKESFKQMLARPIRIENASNPVIFDYRAGNDVGENEQVVLNQFNKRLNDFLNQNHSLLEKFGSVVIYNNQTKQWELNKKNVDIILDISENIRGKGGNQKCMVKFQLKNSRLFDFNENGPQPNYSVPIDIIISLNPNINFEINDNVEIIPYMSASDDNNQYYLEQTDLNQVLGGNQPNPLMIDRFNIDINKPNRQGIYPLIDNNKIPIISQQGTTIKANVEIRINDLVINKELVFERLYTNGELISSITINPQDYQGSNIQFVDNQLTFKIQMFKDQIFLSNPEPFYLRYVNNSLVDNQNPPNIQLRLTHASATIPSEQITKLSKWVQIEEASFDEKNEVQYVGTYETFDPFIFRFRTLKIELRDPITGEFIGHASKYKPFIRKGKYTKPSTFSSRANNGDETIFPKPEMNDEQSVYEANLGSYVMKNKSQNGKYDFQIVIKEYDENSNASDIADRYTKDRWIIGVTMNLLSSQASFVMSGYKDNKLIQEENKQKFFNKDSEYYRGDYINEETGMYMPKIVWVNAFPPESFLYDPLDANNNLIVNKNHASQEEIKKAKYDIGYIAELNATGFSNNDYSSLPTFGGYETNFDTNIFVPTGLVPYSEFYQYNKNDIEPSVQRVPLSQSGLQTIKSSDDFRQIVLKRPNSNNYLYQFVKIANTSKEITQNKDVISLYGNLKGLNNEPLFVDFWQTYQGQHLSDYLLNDAKLIENEQKLKELSYNDVMQYWNIYVNDPKHYDQSHLNQNDYNGTKDISELQTLFKEIIISSADFNEIKKLIIDQITNQLQTILVENGYMNENIQLQYGRHFEIEDTNLIFENKIKTLIDNYNLPLNEAKLVEFKITMIDSAFTNQLMKPTGSVTIKVLNNKDANQIIDLSKYSGSKLSINSNHEYFQSSEDMIGLIKQTIYESIDLDLKRIIDQSQLKLDPPFIPQLNKDYKLTFYTKYFDKYNNEQVYKYHSIEEAIKGALLYETDKNVFYNSLFIDISAIFNDTSHLMINSFTKTIVNNSSQTDAIVDYQPFSLSSIKANDIKINTQATDFPSDLTKSQTILNLIIDRVYNDIYFYARRWIQINQIQLNYLTDFEIVFIKEFDQNNKPIYYENNDQQSLLNIINDVLLNNIENEPQFNRDLYFEVRAMKGSLLEGSYIKKVNNNYLNKAIEDDNLNESVNLTPDQDNDNESSSSNDNNNGSKLDLANDKSNNNDLDWWWVVTPVTVLALTITVLLIIYIIRKNRKIR